MVVTDNKPHYPVTVCHKKTIIFCLIGKHCVPQNWLCQLLLLSEYGHT